MFGQQNWDICKHWKQILGTPIIYQSTPVSFGTPVDKILIAFLWWSYDSSWLSDGTFWYNVPTNCYIPLAFKLYPLIYGFSWIVVTTVFLFSIVVSNSWNNYLYSYLNMKMCLAWVMFSSKFISWRKEAWVPTLTLRPECCSILSSCLQFSVYREKILLLWKDFVNPASYESINNSYMEQISIKFKEHNLSIPNTT